MLDPLFQYNEEIHHQYEKQGYFFFDHFLTKDGLDFCRQKVQAIINRIPSDQPPEALAPHQCGEKWIAELAREPAILDMIMNQVGPDVVLWSSHLICKQPHTGRALPWHQDAPYWNITGRLSCAIWIPFDDVDEDNGGMSIIPGWHTKGTLLRHRTDTAVFNEEIDSDTLPDDVDLVKVQYRLRAGQMAIHHTMIPHNSVPNCSNRWRRVLVLRYLSADGEMGPKQYPDFRTGEMYERQGLLVHGEDKYKRGWLTMDDL